MNKPTGKTTPGEKIIFRWRFIALPVAVLLLALALTAFFYGRLPAEAAYHFENGTADRWMGRGALVAWLVLPQFFLTLLAWATVSGATFISNRFQPVNRGWVERILMLMGNMIAQPQIILCFAMLDIFSYNAYQIHLLPLWVFAVIVIGVGGILLGIFFTRAIRLVRGKGSAG